MGTKQSKRTTSKGPPPRIPKGGPDWRAKFLKHLESVGVVIASCRAAGVSQTTAYETRQSDAAFARDWEDAIEAHTQSLESELYRRAVKDGDTTALIFALKAKRPGVYREARSEIHLHTEAKAAPGPVAGAAISAGLDAAKRVQSEMEGAGDGPA